MSISKIEIHTLKSRFNSTRNAHGYFNGGGSTVSISM